MADCCLSACVRRHLLHHCFQALMDHGVKVASVLASSFSRRCSYIAESDAHVKEKAIQFGFVLGGPLLSAGRTGSASCVMKCFFQALGIVGTAVRVLGPIPHNKGRPVSERFLSSAAC